MSKHFCLVHFFWFKKKSGSSAVRSKDMTFIPKNMTMNLILRESYRDRTYRSIVTYCSSALEFEDVSVSIEIGFCDKKSANLNKKI